MKTIRLLILEDDLEVLSLIMGKLFKIEEKDKSLCFSVAVLSEYSQVETYINGHPEIKYDILILDRDDKVGGSFHVADLKNFDLDKVIAISSVPEYNAQAEKAGVKKVVLKDFSNLELFINNVIEYINHII